VKTGDAVGGSQVVGVVGKQEPSKTQTLIKSMAMLAIGALVFAAANSLFRSAFSHVGAISRAPGMLVDDGKAGQLPAMASKPNLDDNSASTHRTVDNGTDAPRVVVNSSSTTDQAATCQTTARYTSNDGTVASYSSDGCGQQGPAREQRTQTTNRYSSNSSRGTGQPAQSTNSGGSSYNGSPSQSQPNDGGSSQTYQDTTVGQPTIKN
jgi:hypothetical protein